MPRAGVLFCCRAQDAHAVPCSSPPDAEQNRFFGVELDTKHGARQWLTYEVVYAYALAPDQQPRGKRFQLESEITTDPANENEATARSARGRPRQPSFSLPGPKAGNNNKRHRPAANKKKKALVPVKKKKTTRSERRGSRGKTTKRSKIKRSIPKLAVRGGADSDCDTFEAESCTESEVEEMTVHRTDPKDWKQIKEGQTDQTIQPMPYVPHPADAKFLQDDNHNGNDFDVKTTEEEVEAMKDPNGDIMFTSPPGCGTTCFT